MDLQKDVAIVGKFLSTLPEDDDHPYRTGPWRPQTNEWDADDLAAVEGEIPRDLDGIYLRNTENPLHPAFKTYHPFDGDGMVHVVGFRDGKAFYRNRFVRTDGFLAENEAGGLEVQANLYGGASGPALIFRSGEEMSGTWSRSSLGQATQFTTSSGQPISLQPGQTWVELVPNTITVTGTPPA